MISCSMTPTQYSLVEIFDGFAKNASNLKLVALGYLAEARKALVSGATELYNSLITQYDNALNAYNSYVETIKTLIATISPMPLSGNSVIYGSITSYQKEWASVAKGVVSDFTMYLPQKILELITAVVPVGLSVPIPVIGSVDIIEFFNNTTYRASIKTQVGGALEGISSAITSMYSGVLGGVASPQMRLHEVWVWVCQQISTGGMKLIYDAFAALIAKFKTTWNPMQLPALPALVTLDIEGIIQAVITSSLTASDLIVNSAKNTYDSILNAYQNGTSSLQDLREARDQLLQSVKDKWNSLITNLLNINVFGITLGTLVTISPNTSTRSSEDIISDIISQAKDFVNNYILNIFISWMDLVKNFFNAVGLAALVPLITFNFCNFLDLIGLNLP